MGFKKAEVDQLLAETGRRCCLCRQRRQVQVHHIVPTEQGGSDEIDNAIPLCPNCHDEVHGGYEALGLNEMLFRLDYVPMERMHRMMEDRFRSDQELGRWMDDRRNEAVELINSILRELGHSEVASIR